jgi:hypothetical protein
MFLPDMPVNDGSDLPLFDQHPDRDTRSILVLTDADDEYVIDPDFVPEQFKQDCVPSHDWRDDDPCYSTADMCYGNDVECWFGPDIQLVA